MTKKHARRSPSSSKRWINCPGCLLLSDKCPPPGTSKYAQEGTDAHYLAEQLLKYGECTDLLPGCELCEEGGTPFLITEEMKDAVDVYTQAVREAKGLSGKLLVEAKFTLEWLYENMFGTNDALVYDAENKKLSIYDYKHGQGIIVEPEWNTQLMMYGLGGMHRLWQELTGEKPVPVLKLFDTIELVIVQPRAMHAEGAIRRWEIPAKDLFFWGLNVLKPAAERTEDPKAPLRAGDHCRFCPALAVCPEQVKNAVAIAKTDFENPILPSPQSMQAEDILKVMEVASVFGSWSDEVKKYAQDQMRAGVQFPGYKLVKRNARRKWSNEGATEELLVALLGEEAHTRKLLSIAQAEKALKKQGLSPQTELEGTWHKEDTGVTMVPESDRRKEVAPPAITEFIDDADFLQ